MTKLTTNYKNDDHLEHLKKMRTKRNKTHKNWDKKSI